MTTINEMGEFSVPEPFDPDVGRATAYASLRAIDIRKAGNDEPADSYIPCGICGEMFVPSRQRKKYCSDGCRIEARRRAWRKQWNERKNK